VTRFGQLIYNLNYRYEPFGCLSILFHTPVVFINSSIWSGDQTKLSSSVSALNTSSLFIVSAWQFLIRWIGVSTSFRQYLHTLPEHVYSLKRWMKIGYSFFPRPEKRENSPKKFEKLSILANYGYIFY
jgi:hypothetical protein